MKIKKRSSLKKIFLPLLILLTSTLSSNEVSFFKSKQTLRDYIYDDNQITFYCNNPYYKKRVGRYPKLFITQNNSIYTPRNIYTKKGKINKRARMVEWEHVMPAHNFGRHLDCWKKGGRKECRNDKLFNIMEGDMHNLVPSIGEVNGDRLNFKYSHNTPNKRQYGECPVEIDFKYRRISVKQDIHGDIARIYFYMSDKYNINLSKKEIKLFTAWNIEDPVDAWEIEKNKRVHATQGNYNKYISN